MAAGLQSLMTAKSSPTNLTWMVMKTSLLVKVCSEYLLYIDSPDEKRDTTKYENAYPPQFELLLYPSGCSKSLNLMDLMPNLSRTGD
jgi:hypothetical protein